MEDKEKKKRILAFALTGIILAGMIGIGMVFKEKHPVENVHQTEIPSVQGESEETEKESPEEVPLPEGSTVLPMASEHFAMEEYACDCPCYCDGWPTAMDEELLEKIEELRQNLGSPIVITSGVRCPRWNEEVGGVDNSKHLHGHAADLYCPDVDIHIVAEEAVKLGLTVLTYYDQGYIHVEN